MEAIADTYDKPHSTARGIAVPTQLVVDALVTVEKEHAVPINLNVTPSTARILSQFYSLYVQSHACLLSLPYHFAALKCKDTCSYQLQHSCS